MSSVAHRVRQHWKGCSVKRSKSSLALIMPFRQGSRPTKNAGFTNRPLQCAPEARKAGPAELLIPDPTHTTHLFSALYVLLTAVQLD